MKALILYKEIGHKTGQAICSYGIGVILLENGMKYCDSPEGLLQNIQEKLTKSLVLFQHEKNVLGVVHCYSQIIKVKNQLGLNSVFELKELSALKIK